MDSLTGIPGSTVKVFAKGGDTFQVFREGRAAALQLGMCLSPPSSDDFTSQRALSVLWEHVEGCRPLCVVMSPAHNRLLDLAVETATAQLRNGRHFCVNHANGQFIESRQKHEGFQIY